jgi:outer membrane protein OmpA-like peptidoglycan-associated protein
MKKFIVAMVLGFSAMTSAFAGNNSLNNDEMVYAPLKYETINFTIYFKSGASELSEANIEALGDRVMSYNPSKVYIIGHASLEGSSKKNLELSKERVEAVKDYLVVQGLNSSSIVFSEGVGDNNPVCKEKTKICKENNRRVDIKIEYIK